mmetsp:Transcript_13031/g.30772  ORF Transcript_13031/g.30772 Transcript_13031/m.30772 type:complete len:103 (+) Transcript_13031:1274-1582(+)
MRRGRTDRRQQGISDFFATHRCNPVCRALKLTKGSTVLDELQKLEEQEEGSLEGNEEGGAPTAPPPRGMEAAAGELPKSSAKKKKKKKKGRSRSQSQGPQRL